MSLINEYIDKKLNSLALESELQKLIAQYNKLRGSYLFVYAAAMRKSIPSIGLEQSDFYILRDLLTGKNKIEKVDVYLETPGGSGETAEEIVRFLHNKFKSVSFVISGEAKSAGTIMALSGDEILMTETGSLGPIDAQVQIGRSVVSAHDYIEWVKDRHNEAQEQGALNPFDATMVAQISPGELGTVFHSLKFAEDLVKEWLAQYKFKDWKITKTNRKPVTQNMKKKRATEIAQKLINHSHWRSHGRSIKINDLESIGLKITKIDDSPKLADIVYRIQTVCGILFNTTTSFKILATEDNRIFRQATPATGPLVPFPGPQQAADSVTFEQACEKCGKKHKIFAKLANDPQMDSDFKRKGFTSFPKDAKLTCECGYEIDLTGPKLEIEMATQRPIITEKRRKK